MEGATHLFKCYHSLIPTLCLKMFLHFHLFLCCACLFSLYEFGRLRSDSCDTHLNETPAGKSFVKDATADIDVEIVAAVSSSECYF